MKTREVLSRRHFMHVAATAAASGSVISCARGRSPWRFFTLDQGQTLQAICEQIIPADEDPGAVWAGVVNFIDLQMVGPYSHHQRTYRLGLVGTDESSKSMFNRRFVELPDERQIQVLTAMEKDQAPGETWQKLSARSFFNLVVEHTMQGFYGGPRHGGNREWISWKMLGIPHPPVRGRQRYQSAPATTGS